MINSSWPMCTVNGLCSDIRLPRSPPHILDPSCAHDTLRHHRVETRSRTNTGKNPGGQQVLVLNSDCGNRLECGSALVRYFLKGDKRAGAVGRWGGCWTQPSSVRWTVTRR